MTAAWNIAEWVAGLRFSDIPPRVVEKAKYQCLSVLAAIYPGSRSPGGGKIFTSISSEGRGGPCSVIPTGVTTTPENAVLAHSAFSIAYDFDDYLFMGHPCHSAVTVPLSLCQQLGRGGKDFLLAQVIANEVEGRLGAAVLMGPHNGQTWSFIHAVGSACAAVRLMDLPPEKVVDAVGIALYQPNYVLFPGFMGPDTKLLTAGVPASAGLLAARLAQYGFTGSHEIIESPQGFLRHFSFLPFEGMLSGWGRSWVLDTICFKPYPGCAYIDSTIDALLTALKEFQEKHRRPLAPDEVKHIGVRATIMTIGMDGLSRRRIKDGAITSVLMNFSIPLSAAAAVIAGRLTSQEMSPAFIEKNRAALLSLAGKVSLSTDWGMTMKITESLYDTGVLKVINKGLTIRDIVRARRNLGKGAGSELPVSARSSLALLSTLFTSEGRVIRKILAQGIKNIFTSGKDGRDLGDVDFTRLRFPFSAEVTLETTGGETFRIRQDIPLGAQGRPQEEINAVVRDKFLREAGPFLGQKTETAMNAVLALDSLPDISPLIAACCP